MRTCIQDNCDRPHRARGLCGSHYNQTHAKDRHATAVVPCFICDKPTAKASGGNKARASVCSTECRKTLQFGTPLPDDHWARWYGKSSDWTPPKDHRPTFISNQCGECGASFIELNHGQPSTHCSKRCARRVMKRARKAREHGASGSFRWIDVIRLWTASGKRCSYCDMQMTEQPEPDHVVPISRGGRNDLGNIVPCCRSCNADKCDMTLTEWAIERERQGKPPRRYELPFSDPRFKHLTMGSASGTAWRHGVQLAA
jgi:5-methylcytosine-specific restriction endonuclease McrA